MDTPFVLEGINKELAAIKVWVDTQQTFIEQGVFDNVNTDYLVDYYRLVRRLTILIK